MYILCVVHMLLVWVVFLSTVRISDETKRVLVLVNSRIQEMFGRKVSFDETIRFLAELFLRRGSSVMDLFGVLRGLDVEELHSLLRVEREGEEERLRRLEGEGGC